MKKTRTNEAIGSYPVTKEIFSRDKLTGELESLGELELHTKQKNRNAGFFMLWLYEIRPKDLKTKFLYFLIQNNRKGICLATNEYLAKKFDCSEKTIRTLKQTMREEGYIKYKPGYILINPNFVWIGSATSREKANKEYLAFKQEPPKPP